MNKNLFNTIFIQNRIKTLHIQCKSERGRGIKRPYLTQLLNMEDGEFEILEKMDPGLKEKFDNIERSQRDLIDYVLGRVDPKA